MLASLGFIVQEQTKVGPSSCLLLPALLLARISWWGMD